MLLATYFIAENGNNKESDDNKNSSEILEELPNTPPRKKMKTEEFVTPDEGNLLFIFKVFFLNWHSYQIFFLQAILVVQVLRNKLRKKKFKYISYRVSKEFDLLKLLKIKS